jgi:hypothetical protein
MQPHPPISQMFNAISEEQMNNSSSAVWIARIDQMEKQRPRAPLLLAMVALCMLILGSLFLILGFESLNDAIMEMTTELTPGSATFVTSAIQLSRQTFGFGLVFVVSAALLGGKALVWFERLRVYRAMHQQRP